MLDLVRILHVGISPTIDVGLRPTYFNNVGISPTQIGDVGIMPTITSSVAYTVKSILVVDFLLQTNYPFSWAMYF